MSLRTPARVSPNGFSWRRLAITLGATGSLVVGLFGLAPAEASPTTYYVDPTNPVDLSNPNVNCAQPYTNSVAAAVAAASPGDTVYLCPGTHVVAGGVNVTKDLMFAGAGRATSIVVPSTVGASLFNLPTAGTTIAFEDIAMEDSCSAIGASGTGSTITVTHVRFEDNTCTASAGSSGMPKSLRMPGSATSDACSGVIHCCACRNATYCALPSGVIIVPVGFAGLATRSPASFFRACTERSMSPVMAKRVSAVVSISTGSQPSAVRMCRYGG